MKKKIVNTIMAGACLFSGMGLSGCAAVGTVAEHHSLQTNTKMSNTVFLDPVPNSEKTAYLQVSNTSGQPTVSFSSELKNDLSSQGYRVVSSPDQAHYMIQANVVSAGKTTTNNMGTILSAGYGSAIGTGLMGAGAGALMTDSGEGVLVGGLIGAAAGFAADALIKDEIYGMVTDVQLSERSNSGKNYLQRTVANAEAGSGAVSTITSTERTPWIRYRTRVVTSVDQMNLSFAKASIALRNQTASSIAGLFV